MDDRLEEVFERLDAIERRLDALTDDPGPAGATCAFLSEERRIVDLIVRLVAERLEGSMDARMDRMTAQLASRRAAPPQHAHQGRRPTGCRACGAGSPPWRGRHDGPPPDGLPPPHHRGPPPPGWGAHGPPPPGRDPWHHHGAHDPYPGAHPPHDHHGGHRHHHDHHAWHHHHDHHGSHGYGPTDPHGRGPQHPPSEPARGPGVGAGEPDDGDR